MLVIIAVLSHSAIAQVYEAKINGGNEADGIMNFLSGIGGTSFTGDANYQVNLMLVPAGGDLDFPIVLSYSSGSIKENLRSGSVGFGWNINIMNEVTRSVNGVVDEQDDAWFGQPSTNEFYLGGQTSNWSHYSTRDGAFKGGVIHDGAVDADEWDSYVVSTPYGTSSIVPIEDNGQLGSSLEYFMEKPFKNWIVSYQQFNGTDDEFDHDQYVKNFIKSFGIKDGTGKTFTFDKPYFLKIQEYKNGGISRANTDAFYKYPISWKMTKIESPNSNNEITFHYNDYAHGEEGNTPIQFSYLHDMISLGGQPYGRSTSTYIPNSSSSSYGGLNSYLYYDKSYLDYIETESHTVDLVFIDDINNIGDDGIKSKLLQYIILKKKGTNEVVKKVKLSYLDSIHDGNGLGDSREVTLLSKIEIIDVENSSNTLDYDFTYYSNNANEPVDWFGYIGTNNLLKTINPPTGGTVTYNYEERRYQYYLSIGYNGSNNFAKQNYVSSSTSNSGDAYLAGTRISSIVIDEGANNPSIYKYYDYGEGIRTEPNARALIRNGGVVNGSDILIGSIGHRWVSELISDNITVSYFTNSLSLPGDVPCPAGVTACNSVDEKEAFSVYSGVHSNLTNPGQVLYEPYSKAYGRIYKIEKGLAHQGQLFQNYITIETDWELLPSDYSFPMTVSSDVFTRTSSFFVYKSKEKTEWDPAYSNDKILETYYVDYTNEGLCETESSYCRPEFSEDYGFVTGPKYIVSFYNGNTHPIITENQYLLFNNSTARGLSINMINYSNGSLSLIDASNNADAVYNSINTSMINDTYPLLKSNFSTLNLKIEGGTYTKWNTNGDGFLRPRSVWNYESPNLSRTTSGSLTLPTTSNALETLTYEHYDGFGHPLEVKNAAGIYTSYDWTEDGVQSTGIFQNAQKEKIYAHSFAYDGLGDWVFKNRLDPGGTIIDVTDGKLRISDDGAVNGERDRVVYKHPSEISGTVVWEFDVQIANSDNWGLLFGSGGSSWNDWSAGGTEAAVWAAIKDEDFLYYDRNLSQYVEAKSNLEIGKTYSFKIVMNSSTDRVDYYIDGELVGDDIIYAKYSSSGIQELMFANFGHTTLSDSWYIDNVRFYPEYAQAQTQEVDKSALKAVAIKNVAGITTRYDYDGFNRPSEIHNANDYKTNSFDYNYTKSQSGFSSSNPNSIITTSHYSGGDLINKLFYDGVGRDIQSHVVGGNKTIITENRYNEKGELEVTSRPIELSSQNTYKTNLLEGTGTFSAPGQLYSNSAVQDYWDSQSGITTNDANYGYSFSSYDNLSRPIKTTLPGYNWRHGQGNEIEYLYDFNSSYEGIATQNMSWSSGKLTRKVTTDPSEKKKVEYVDYLGRVIASGTDINSDGRLKRSDDDLVTEFEYDLRGNLIRTEDPRDLATTYTYNTLGQLVEKKLPDQEYSNKYCYDDMGRLRFHLDPNDTADPFLYYENHYDYIYYKYDDFGRVIEVGQQQGFNTSNPTETSFNWACNSSTFLNDQNEPNSSIKVRAEYFYDGDGAYSGARNLTAKLTKVRYNEYDEYYVSTTYGYTYYSYNELGLVEWVVQDIPGLSNDIKITYTYDELGRLTQMGYNVTNSTDDHYYWYEYDGFGRLRYVYSDTDSNPSGRIKEAEYSSYLADGNVVQTKLGNSNVQTIDNTYTIQGWINTINSEYILYSTDKFGLNLDYELNGNISLQKWAQAGKDASKIVQYAYTYDSANRLTAANYTNTYGAATDDDNNGYDVTYTYDDNGNMLTAVRKSAGYYSYPQQSLTSSTISGSSNRLSTYSVQNGPTSPVSYSVVYDANGNMKNNRYTNAVFDWRNLMTKVTKGGTTIRFGYDMDGNRTMKEVVGGVKTNYIRGANGETLAIYENGSRKFVNLINPSGEILGTYDGSERRYFLKDHLGTVRATVDQSGNIDGYDDYYPFGQVMPGRSSNSSNPTDNYKYTGHERDDEGSLGLDYAGARNYDSILGKWTGIDPLNHQVDPNEYLYHSVSPYNYTLNNPISNFDPNGLWVITIQYQVRGQFFGSLSGTIGIALDDDYNVALFYTVGGGGGLGAGVSAGIEGTLFPGMDTIDELKGGGVSFAAYAGIYGGIGIEFNTTFGWWNGSGGFGSPDWDQAGGSISLYGIPSTAALGAGSTVEISYTGFLFEGNVAKGWDEFIKRLKDIYGFEEEEANAFVEQLKFIQNEANRAERRNNWYHNLQRNVNNGCKDSDGLYTASCN
ncbi:MAG: RHS repeat-associated core domain-containing protein [Balneolaceae bacterium]|nr:RHS repeat-associated core domain-containing protein [Balneolaceae bacterium]MBO6546183.1 RHS repeat-associated core domain-containing protein [Balneolaceae bacterium]MBO6648541.1 RHS repeat-associated core domain-containing protein [Balneolaceae bacterium]